MLLIRNPADNARFPEQVLAQGTFPPAADGSVWVANVVKLRRGERVSINITGDFRSDLTFWGAYELH